MPLPGGYVLPDPPEVSPAAEEGPKETREEKEARRQLESASLPTKAITAFVLVLTEDGNWVANGNFAENGLLPPLQALKVRRAASIADIAHGASLVAADADRLVGAGMAAQAIAQHAQAQMRAREEAQSAQRLLQNIGPLRA